MEPVLLTEESIKGYGYLLHESKKKPAFDNEQFTFIGEVFKFTSEVEITIGILTGNKRPVELERLEKHSDTVEILIELENDSIIYLAKPSEKDDNIEGIKAFYFNQGQAIALDKGTWHWIPYPNGSEYCKTLVIFKDKTGVNDCKIKEMKNITT